MKDLVPPSVEGRLLRKLKGSKRAKKKLNSENRRLWVMDVLIMIEAGYIPF